MNFITIKVPCIDLLDEYAKEIYDFDVYEYNCVDLVELPTVRDKASRNAIDEWYNDNLGDDEPTKKGNR